MNVHLLYVMASLYIAAGLMHFIRPKAFVSIMPPYLPFHRPLVYLSGACEILFAILLLPETTRSIAAWLIILLLISVFPANIQMAVTFYRKRHRALWIALLRLPLQALLIWWAWIYTR